jgi:type IV pilus assembly protein PilC
MQKFTYVAIAADNSQVRGVEEALTAGLARTALVDRGLQPIELTEKKSIWQFEVTRKRVPRRDLMHFSRQLGVFIRAGIPILDALDVITGETDNKLFKKALGDIMEGLRSGQTFAVAVASHPEAFPPFYQEIVRSAELTGNLDVVLDQLADYIERDLTARQNITSALAYPGVVMVMSIVTVVVLTAFVLPRFENFFSQLHAKLPLPTRMLLSVAHLLTNWWFVFVGGAVALLIGSAVLVRTPKGRAALDSLFLRMPVLGDLIQHAILERFCRVLSSLITAAVPLPEAMAVTSDATSNAVYRRGLAEAREAMLHGEGLAGPLAATNLFPASAKQMFRVGENTGTLDAQLQTAATYFDRELSYKIKRFTSLFEPAVIIFMGLVVGFVAVALVSAMYGIFHQSQVLH